MCSVWLGYVLHTVDYFFCTADPGRTGFFRVDYSDTLLLALAEHSAQIPSLDRAAMLDDLLALVRSAHKVVCRALARACECVRVYVRACVCDCLRVRMHMYPVSHCISYIGRCACSAADSAYATCA